MSDGRDPAGAAFAGAIGALAGLALTAGRGRRTRVAATVVIHRRD